MDLGVSIDRLPVSCWAWCSCSCRRCAIRTELAAQTERIVEMVGKARRNLPEHGPGGVPRVRAARPVDEHRPRADVPHGRPRGRRVPRRLPRRTASGAASRSWRRTRTAIPTTPGIILDDQGELRLYYRKLHPWVPVEPWEPGDLGIPVCDGPRGSRIGLIICHDGMFPEMARECAYKGAEIILRTAGYTAPIRHAWRITNQANAFCNLAVTASVCLCGSDGTFDSMGEGMIVNFDGVPLATGGGRPDEIITAEVRPDLVREARRAWGVENNIYQLGHRGYVAVDGGAGDCPYTYMRDLVAGRYRLPWEDEVVARRRDIVRLSAAHAALPSAPGDRADERARAARERACACARARDQ